MRKPEKARAAGIEMKQWNTADQEILARRDSLIEQLIERAMNMKESKRKSKKKPHRYLKSKKKRY